MMSIVELDPLTLKLYPGATHDRDVSEDPMVEEFVASLVGSPIDVWPSLAPPINFSDPQPPDEAPC